METHRFLQQHLGTDVPSYQTFANLQQQFRLGREYTLDFPHSGRPSEVDVGSISARISEIIQSDRRVSVRRIADDLGESYGTIWMIIHEELCMNKLATRWVPRILTTPIG